MKPTDNYFSIESVKAILLRIEQQIKKISKSASEDYLTDSDLQRELNVSRRTTANWRAKKTIPYSKIKGIILYQRSDVKKFIEKHQVSSVKSKSRI